MLSWQSDSGYLLNGCVGLRQSWFLSMVVCGRCPCLYIKYIHVMITKWSNLHAYTKLFFTVCAYLHNSLQAPVLTWYYSEWRTLLCLHKIFLFLFTLQYCNLAKIDWRKCLPLSKQDTSDNGTMISQNSATYQESELVLDQRSIPWAHAHVTTVVKINHCVLVCVCSCTRMNLDAMQHPRVTSRLHRRPHSPQKLLFVCLVVQLRHGFIQWCYGMLISRVKGLQNSNMAVLWPCTSSRPNCLSWQKQWVK